MSNGLKQDISIGKNLKQLRKSANLTQEQVSAQLQIMGISISTDILAKMEQGRYSIKISVLIALKQIYNVDSYDAFFDGI